MAELCPPKPKELDSPYFNGSCLASNTTSKLQSGSCFSTLIVGGIIPRLKLSTKAIASTPPAKTKHVPSH